MAGKSKNNDKIKGPAKSISSLSAKKQQCAASYGRGQARKQRRREVQATAAARNRETVAAGGLTPWQQAKAAARFRKGVGADLSPDDVTRLTALKEEDGIPVRKVSSPTAREAVRTAKRGGKRD
jgi:hypothetical protein